MLGVSGLVYGFLRQPEGVEKTVGKEKKRDVSKKVPVVNGKAAHGAKAPVAR